MGGLWPGTVEPITPAELDEIFHHWHEVRRRTGQMFMFEGATP
jgi:protein-disulfide isomerase-like protein with CxxC motif